MPGMSRVRPRQARGGGPPTPPTTTHHRTSVLLSLSFLEFCGQALGQRREGRRWSRKEGPAGDSPSRAQVMKAVTALYGGPTVCSGPCAESPAYRPHLIFTTGSQTEILVHGQPQQVGGPG